MFSYQLECRNNANYNETSVSSDFRTVIWDFAELGIGTTFTITYKAEAEIEFYGSNIVSVITSKTAVSIDLVRVKVHDIGQPVMDATKSVWDETSNSWRETGTTFL